MAYSMNTSGNNITVNINGTAGSLYVRMGFFHQYPDVKDFRSCVAAMTYGDDFKGSVKKDYRRFNIETFASFLAKHNMRITLPDKSDNMVAFMDDRDADFLKRKSNFIPEINCKIGCLDEESIIRPLHCNMKSRETREEVAASCVETAMHEWFAHGREHYDMRATQMKEICRRADIPVPALHITYDERVTSWQQKYCPSV
jgi:hypothetical protein